MKTEEFKEFNIHKDSLRRCGLRKTDYCVSDPIQRRSTGVKAVRSSGKIPTDRNCTVKRNRRILIHRNRGSEEDIDTTCYSESKLEEETVHRGARQNKHFMIPCTSVYITTLIKLDDFTLMFILHPLINYEPHNESKVVLTHEVQNHVVVLPQTSTWRPLDKFMKETIYKINF